MPTDLEKQLERLSNALGRELQALEHTAREHGKAFVKELADQIEQHALSHAEVIQKRELDRYERKRLRRAERRARKREQSSALVGAVMLLAAAVCVAMAWLNPEVRWLVFVALGLAVGGARDISLALERGRLERQGAQDTLPLGWPAPASESAPAPVAESPHEVDVLCDGLLAELKESPEAVRSFLRNPEKTVESLRTTCKALDVRRRQLLAAAPGAQRAVLQARTAELTAKRDSLTDALAREKLEGALRSLVQQGEALDELSAISDRVDGEYTALLVLLQEMRTRVTVAKSAASDVNMEALRQNVQRLNGELEAITSAVQEVQLQGSPGLGSRIRDR